MGRERDAARAEHLDHGAPVAADVLGALALAHHHVFLELLDRLAVAERVGA